MLLKNKLDGQGEYICKMVVKRSHAGGVCNKMQVGFAINSEPCR